MVRLTIIEATQGVLTNRTEDAPELEDRIRTAKDPSPEGTLHASAVDFPAKRRMTQSVPPRIIHVLATARSDIFVPSVGHQ